MEVRVVEVVAVINQIDMRKYIAIGVLFLGAVVFAQEKSSETAGVFKKRVLESIEVDFLMSYYSQDGDHASVTGGIGTEELTDITPTFIVSLPLNDDDVLTIEAGISAYTSASSGNLDPFDSLSGASQGGDDDDDNFSIGSSGGSPWIESSGASNKDTWVNGNVSYAHSSDDRNSIWTANVNFAAEYDYTSIGFGGGYTKLFNQKNTELGIKGQVYLDTWQPRYPTELDSYLEAGKDLNNGFFGGVDILDEGGSAIDKNGFFVWKPIFEYMNDKSRNTYSISLSFSQILSKNAQFSLFLDVVQQSGWLSNPMQRVYFSDTQNYFIGESEGIPVYDTRANTSVFQLADDIEKLPSTRFKIPIGIRFNYYINEIASLRTYYRYYYDDWGIEGHTVNFELPIKIGGMFTVYPNYRYYKQTAVDYFAPFKEHFSTDEFYTSDYDLSGFDSHQFGLGIKYTDILAKSKLYGFGLKTIDLRYSSYDRSDGLTAGIISFGIKFVQ